MCLINECLLLFFFLSASFFSEGPNTTERFRSQTQARQRPGWSRDQNAHLAIDTAASIHSQFRC